MSIQVCLSGYSFKIGGGGDRISDWMPSDRMFTAPEFQKSYDEVEISLLTPKVALVPSYFFDPSSIRDILALTVALKDDDLVDSIPAEGYKAELIYSLSIGEVLSGAIANTVSSGSSQHPKVLPEMFFILRDLQALKDYNRIVASFADRHLHLAIARGDDLLLANVFDAVDFTTAEYFIFLALKKLQLNPEASAIYFRTPLSGEEEMSLYRYFKAVEKI